MDFMQVLGYPQIGVREGATIIPIARYFYSDAFPRIGIEEFLINQADIATTFICIEKIKKSWRR